MKRVVIAGGSGFIGQFLARQFAYDDIQVTILSRRGTPPSAHINGVTWNAHTRGNWEKALEGADMLINLCGRSVDCRYNEKNKKEIFQSRLIPTRLLGEAVAACSHPPAVWVQMTSATIYRHAEDKPMDEISGEIGDGFSVDVCQAWEKTFSDIHLPQTRKIILRTAFVLGKQGGALQAFVKLARFGLGGTMGKGNQMCSWIHERDLCRIIRFLHNNPEAQGIFNTSSPGPINNEDFMRHLRAVCSVPFGLPAYTWMLAIGTWLARTEMELIVKSRWVIPRRITELGFQFEYSNIQNACRDLLK